VITSIAQVRSLLSTLPKSVLTVMRYLFAFLNQYVAQFCLSRFIFQLDTNLFASTLLGVRKVSQALVTCEITKKIVTMSEIGINSFSC